ncbi:MAG TPA: DUF1559 domain-containing protein [Pirellulaceae bacterium]|nr:DUF1559 domain-containing protein [Pirellulaceae bacterium]
MMAAGPNPLEMLLMFLLGGGFGLPSGVPPTAQDPLAQKIAPADCLYYMSWAGAGIPDAASGNHTEKMLAEPEVQGFLNRAGDSLLDAFEQVQRDPNAQATFDSIKQALKLIRGKPGAFYVADVQMNGNGPPDVTGGGLLQMGEDGPALQQLLEGLQSKAEEGQITEVQFGNRKFYRVVADEDAPAITWGLAGQYLIVGIGDKAVEDLMERARGPEPAWLTSAKTKLAVPRISSVMYVNVKKIVDLVTQASGEPEAERVVSVLGLDKVGAAVMVNGLDDKGCVSRASLSLDGPATGILSGLDAPPLDAADLNQISSTSPAAIAFKLDTAKLYDLWIDLATQIDPDSAQEMLAGMQQMEQQVGLRIRDDLLGSLGDTWRIYAQPGPAGLISGWTIAINVRDRQKLEQVQNTLVAMAKAGLEQAGPGGPTLRSSQIAGHTVHTLSFGQPGALAAPSWCITDDDLLIAVTPQALTLLLSGTRQSDSLAQNADVKKLFQGDSRTLAFAYLDTQQIAKTLIPFAQLGIKMAAGQRGGPQLTTDGLPSQESIVPHLQPALFALQRTADGVEFTSYQTLPGGNVGASAPVMVALLLPAVQAAREAARRMQGSNNLKQIGLALHNYHDTYRAFPAGYSADADGNPLLSWRVHILPFVEQGALYEQFHLDEPWDSAHNKTLIAQMPPTYRCPNSVIEPGMTNYLGIAGSDGVFVRPQAGERLGVSFRNITDGTSNTIMTVEVPDESAVIWTKPADFSPNVEDPTKGLTGLRPGGFQVGFADGSVRFIAEMIDVGTLRALFTKAGGEAVELP